MAFTNRIERVPAWLMRTSLSRMSAREVVRTCVDYDGPAFFAKRDMSNGNEECQLAFCQGNFSGEPLSLSNGEARIYQFSLIVIDGDGYRFFRLKKEIVDEPENSHLPGNCRLGGPDRAGPSAS
jgi:hypothetical protein